VPLRVRFIATLRTLFRQSSLDRDLDEELRDFAEALGDRKIATGVEPPAARAAARRELGDLALVKADVRAARVGHAIETTVWDARYTLRALAKAPGFTVAAVLTLALGIGATSAIFSIVRAMLMAPLPYRDSSRLVFVWSDMSAIGYPRAPLSAPELKDLRDRAALFDGFGSIWSTAAVLNGDGEPEQLRVGLVSTNFFSLLGADAAVGRTFTSEDESTAAPRTILLTWSLWQRRYGGDRSVVGRAIRVNGQTTTVVGVMPADFRLLMPPDSAVADDLQAFVLLNPQALLRGPRGQQYLRVVGRMKSAVTLEEAGRDIDRVAAAISKEFTEYGANGRVFTTVGLQADGVRQIRPVLLALSGGVAILLFIACVNVASLLAARAAARTRETAVRLSFGASRQRLLRQCLVEGLILAALGSVAGIATGRAGLRLLLTLRPEPLSRLDSAQVDGAVLAVTIATAAGCGILFSLAPLVELRRVDPLLALQSDGRRAGGSLHYRMRSALVLIQIAMSVVLLVGAALMLRSFAALQHVNPGFRSDGTLTFRLALGQRYQTPEAFNAFGRQLQASLLSLPGIKGAGAFSHVPYDTVPNWGGPYLLRRGQDESTAVMADNRAVTPGLLQTIGVELIEGRFFTEDDDQRRDMVVIVDDHLARRSWPGQSAVGQQLASDPFSTGHPRVWATVVGVIRHLRHRTLLDDLNDQIYFSERQVRRNPVAYFVRVAGDPASVAAEVKRAVAALDPELPVADIRPFDVYVSAARAAQRFSSLLALTFGLVALLLATVGVYGVIAYATTRRRHEFGVRLALGARPRDVTSAIVREGVRLAALGTAAGVVVAAGAARLLATQLYGVSPHDPLSYAATVAAIGIAAIVASWLPARRAMTLTPLAALRAD
jgi:putative ABC transport system permease protein